MNAKTKKTNTTSVLTSCPDVPAIEKWTKDQYMKYLESVAEEFRLKGYTVMVDAVKASKVSNNYQVGNYFDVLTAEGNATNLHVPAVIMRDLVSRNKVTTKKRYSGVEVYTHRYTLIDDGKRKQAAAVKPAKKAATRKAKAEPVPNVRVPYDNSQLSRLPAPTFSYERVTFRGLGKVSVRCSEREWKSLTAHRKNRRVVGNAIQVAAPSTVTIQSLLAAAGLKAASNSNLKSKVKVLNPSARWATVEETEAWHAGEVELRRTLLLRLLDAARAKVEDADEDLRELMLSIEKHKENIVKAKASKADLDKQFGFLRLI